MNSQLSAFGNTPITSSIVESLFPDLVGKRQKVQWLEKRGEIIRLKRGLYVVSPKTSGVILSTQLIANYLYAPSYVSMLSALRYYGLIPEAVYTMQSVTLKASRNFHTPIGRFEFVHQEKEAFLIGATTIVTHNYAFLIATPEKALCDLIASTPGVNLRFIKDAALYLEEDIRLDMDAFYEMDSKIFEAYAQVGKKKESIKTLLKLLRK